MPWKVIQQRVLNVAAGQRLDVSIIEEEPQRWDEDWDDDEIDETFSDVLRCDDASRARACALQ